ncbi:18778_t:CDS:2, partial [Gigaspora rosea]
MYTKVHVIACKEEKEENQDHLASCKIYEENWNKIEDPLIDKAWSKKKLKTRSNIMKCLVQEKVVEVLRE